MADLSTDSVEQPLTASVEPTRFTAARYVLLEVRLTPTRHLNPGDVVRIQLPRSWSVWHRNRAKGVQHVDVSLPNHVRLDGDASALNLQVEGGTVDESTTINTRVGVDGSQHRYNWVTRIEVGPGGWARDQSASIVYGGNPGFQAAFHPQGMEPIRVAVSHAGDTFVLPASASPHVDVVADDPVELLASIPTKTRVGPSHPIHISAVDHLHNPTPAFEDLRTEVVSGQAEVHSIDGDLRVQALADGVVRVRVNAGGLSALSNPMLVSHETPTAVRWGDLHVHSEWSYDGTGRDPYGYARDVMGLDYIAVTDHSEGWVGDEWSIIRQRNESENDPGVFVSLNSYEATFHGPYGHHNVYFRGEGGAVSGNNRGTLHDLWGLLREGDAITIPHHTGIVWGGNPTLPRERREPNVDWSIHDGRFRPVVEIYSSHGQCETYDPEHPLAYEKIADFSTARSSTGPHWAQDAWMAGLSLGVVAASDNHASQAGRCHTGLTAVLAGSLTRAGIFDALRQRRCYATTGARMILDLSVNDEPMGSVLMPPPDAGKIRFRAIGTGDIELVEIVRGDVDTQTVKVMASWRPLSNEHSGEFLDEAPPRRGFYYLRVRQAGLVHDRAVMGWSSPVWVGPHDD